MKWNWKSQQRSTAVQQPQHEEPQMIISVDEVDGSSSQVQTPNYCNLMYGLTKEQKAKSIFVTKKGDSFISHWKLEKPKPNATTQSSSSSGSGSSSSSRGIQKKHLHVHPRGPLSASSTSSSPNKRSPMLSLGGSSLEPMDAIQPSPSLSPYYHGGTSASASTPRSATSSASSTPHHFVTRYPRHSIFGNPAKFLVPPTGPNTALLQLALQNPQTPVVVSPIDESEVCMAIDEQQPSSNPKAVQPTTTSSSSSPTPAISSATPPLTIDCKSKGKMATLVNEQNRSPLKCLDSPTEARSILNCFLMNSSPASTVGAQILLHP